MTSIENGPNFTEQNKGVIDAVPELSFLTVALDRFVADKARAGVREPLTYLQTLFARAVVNHYPKGSDARRAVARTPWITTINISYYHQVDMSDYKAQIQKVEAENLQNKASILDSLGKRQLEIETNLLEDEIRDKLIAHAVSNPDAYRISAAPYRGRIHKLAQFLRLRRQGMNIKHVIQALGFTASAGYSYSNTLNSLGYTEGQPRWTGHLDQTVEFDELHQMARQDYPEATDRELVEILTDVIGEKVKIDHLRLSFSRLHRERGLPLKKPFISPEEVEIVKEEIARQARENPGKRFSNKEAERRLGLTEMELRRRLQKAGHYKRKGDELSS